MQNLEPPEVPLELTFQPTTVEPEKKGFFSKLFSKKSKPSSNAILSADTNQELNSDSSSANLPKIGLPELQLPPSLDIANLDTISIDSPELEESDSNNMILPSIEQQITTTSNAAMIAKGKSKGKLKKGQTRSIEKKDVSSQFDWNREITDQEILIHDSNRFNQDANVLITHADNYIDNKNSSMSSNVVLASEHKDREHGLKTLTISELGQLTKPLPETSTEETPVMDEDEQKVFMRISMSHKKLRSTLSNYLRHKKLFSNKEKVMALFKQYDDDIEGIIEDKELELNKRKQYLNRLEKHLKEQEIEINEVHERITDLDKKLKDREVKFNEIVAANVNKELTRRVKIEREALREELNQTALLNTDLKKKVRLIEGDRQRFNIEQQKMSEMERKKLAELQLMYEKKLKESDAEKKTFEVEREKFFARKKAALELLTRADAVSADLERVKKLQQHVDTNKKFVDSSTKVVEQELLEDKELKHAIAKAEVLLIKEKENLDNVVFDKYINNKLKNIKPGYLENRQDWKMALKSNPIYDEVSQCKTLLSQRNLTAAKSLYNTIRKEYEQLDNIPRAEKEAIYTAIRELYNEIQLKIVEIQLRSR